MALIAQYGNFYLLGFLQHLLEIVLIATVWKDKFCAFHTSHLLFNFQSIFLFHNKSTIYGTDARHLL